MSNIFKVNSKDTKTMSFASVVKDYLWHKMITSQNVSLEAQVKIFFLFRRNLCFALKIFKFLYFNLLMIYQIYDMLKSISTRDGSFFNISFELN